MKKTPKMQKYRILSLFTGGMGLDLGLESTERFTTIACIEKEKAFCDTIRRNSDAGGLDCRLETLEADISNLEPAAALKTLGIKRESIDVVVGGPPCQSFSTAGRRGTTQDPRGTLLWDFLRFVEYVRPKIFLMENVRGLLSAALKHRPIAERPNKGGVPLAPDEEPGSVVRLFASDLAGMKGVGYHLDIFEVNAVNYGAPQLRERVLFIGNRYGKSIEFPLPTHGNRLCGKQSPQQTLFDEQPLIPWRTLGEALDGLKDEHPAVLDFSPRKKHFLSLVPPGS
ncbi:MAG: DNA cytosine methyltransferase, partial [Gammaproteobacteria bacterium]|nr:DNA cytosine methyltransferase [Gammaproteobacteria bacterium]